MIGILGILATVTMTTLDPFGQFRKANDAKRKDDLRKIQNALEAYYQDAGRYPDSTGGIIDGNNWGSISWSEYMERIPKDPKDPERVYLYHSDSSTGNQSYVLYGSLETPGDPSLCNSGSACVNLPMGAACGTDPSVICNFGLSSPNISP